MDEHGSAELLLASLADLAPWYAEQDAFQAVARALAPHPELFAAWVERLELRLREPAHDEERRPFPIDCLPEPARVFAAAVAKARSIDPAAPAAMALVALASAVGLSRVLYDEHADWTEPAVLWLAIVAPSGARKSPALRDLFAVHRRRQSGGDRTHERTGHPQGEMTTGEHVLSTDAPAELVPHLLQASPRGLLLVQDELALLLGGFGRARAPSAERAMWLSLHAAEPLKRDRRRGSILLPRAAASIIGAIQPAELGASLSPRALASGLAARFLLVAPEPVLKVYGAGPAPEERAAYEGLVERLFALELDGGRPVRLPLAAGARALLEAWVPRWSEEALGAPGPLQAAWAKLEGAALRFALVLALAGQEEAVGARELERGIRLASWFGAEARRLYRRLGLVEEGLAARDQRTLAAHAAVLRSMGGRAGVREWYGRNTRRPYRAAAAELQALVDAGLAVWRERPSGPRGGRPARECILRGAPVPRGLALRGARESGAGKVNGQARSES